MAIYDEIIQELSQIQIVNHDVRTFNVYKGLPITNPGSILQINNNLVTIKLNKYQATCLEIQRRTYIESNELPRVVRANVVSVDLLQDLAVLTSFVYMPGDIGKRLTVRVQPKDPIPVDIQLKGRNLKAQLSDLSITGAGILTGALLYGQNFFSSRSPINLVFPLPVSQVPIKLAGTIQNVHKELNSFRIGVSTSPDSSTRAVLTRYISMRQAEIQRELRMMYETFYHLASGGVEAPL